MQEKRRHFRKSIRLELEFTAPDGTRRAGVTHDVSLGGLHIETDEPAPFGATITIYLSGVKGLSPTAALPAVVRWLKPREMGVQFGLLGARETYALTELLAGV